MRPALPGRAAICSNVSEVGGSVCKAGVARMTTGKGMTFKTMSEADLEPVLALLQGGDPDAVAQRTGIGKHRLLSIHKDMLAQVEQERSGEASVPAQAKIGRNDRCPCGSGKKYKHCCLNQHHLSENASRRQEDPKRDQRTREAAALIQAIEGAFSLLHDGRYAEAQRRSEALLRRYPNEDRLHDIRATACLHAGRHSTAVRICRSRLAEAEQEKAYFSKNGRYRDAKIEKPALAYFYPPLTWLQKTWIAQKAEAYGAQVPQAKNETICKMVRALETADDHRRYAATQSRGLEVRRTALAKPIEALKRIGSDAVPYLLPIAVRYGWAGLLVPEILAACPPEAADRPLVDISMFGFAYASGASLHYLERRGGAVVSTIEEAFLRDREFDPIKTGIVSVLGNIRTPTAYELLLGLLQHKDPHIVNWAGAALGRHGNPEALSALTAARKRIGAEQMIDQAIFRLQGVAADR